MTEHDIAIESLEGSCRRLHSTRDYHLSEKERHQTEIAALQPKINSLTIDIDRLNAAITQLGGQPVTSADIPSGKKE